MPVEQGASLKKVVSRSRSLKLERIKRRLCDGCQTYCEYYGQARGGGGFYRV